MMNKKIKILGTCMAIDVVYQPHHLVYFQLWFWLHIRRTFSLTIPERESGPFFLKFIYLKKSLESLHINSCQKLVSPLCVIFDVKHILFCGFKNHYNKTYIKKVIILTIFKCTVLWH